jgi:hypothetical protein
MLDIISPLLNDLKNDIKAASSSIEFYYKYAEKLKKLSGYQSGKHFLPKYYSKSLEEFARNVSLKDIETSMREICDKLRVILNLGVNDFQYEVNSADGGLFESPGLTFEIQCSPDKDNINEVIFTSRLAVVVSQAGRLQNAFGAFPFSFSYACVNLPSGIDLKDFIAQLEAYDEKTPSDISYYYDPAVQYLDITSRSSGRRIVMYCDHFEVYFSDDYTVFDLLAGL